MAGAQAQVPPHRVSSEHVHPLRRGGAGRSEGCNHRGAAAGQEEETQYIDNGNNEDGLVGSGTPIAAAAPAHLDEARGGEWRLNGAPAGTLGVLQTPSESQ